MDWANVLKMSIFKPVTMLAAMLLGASFCAPALALSCAKPDLSKVLSKHPSTDVAMGKILSIGSDNIAVFDGWLVDRQHRATPLTQMILRKRDRPQWRARVPALNKDVILLLKFEDTQAVLELFPCNGSVFDLTANNVQVLLNRSN